MPIVIAPSPEITSRISSLTSNRHFQPQQPPPRYTISNAPLDSPFTIVIDTAEQLPFTFTNLRADAAQLHRPLVVRTTRRRLALPAPYHRLSIDYSVEGMESIVGIERKSHEDFCNTLAGKHRARFERKLSIINGDNMGDGNSGSDSGGNINETSSVPPHPVPSFKYFAIIVEAEWSTILAHPPEFSAVMPKTLFRTVIAWQCRYPRIHWMFMPGRQRAEQATYRVLERWWKVLGPKTKQTPSSTPSLQINQP